MKQLVVISGKGGTGKTIVSASFAALVRNKVMADCDVDAANLHLLLHPEIKEWHSFKGGSKARLSIESCTGCGECIKVCRFSAIKERTDGKVNVDPLSCEGCAVCSYICPVEAIVMEENICGEWFISQTKYGPFVHARLGIGEENSGKLVTEVRKRAKEIAEKNSMDFVIIDGPPGIGCPVIASLSGTDIALVVTEPTLSALHDMERVIQTAHHFRTSTACCINKFDLNPRISDEIEEWCAKNSVHMVGKIPFHEQVTESLVQGIPLPEYRENLVSERIKEIWQNLSEVLAKENS